MPLLGRLDTPPCLRGLRGSSIAFDTHQRVRLLALASQLVGGLCTTCLSQFAMYSASTGVSMCSVYILTGKNGNRGVTVEPNPTSSQTIRVCS
jgi:hypothetical protein